MHFVQKQLGDAVEISIELNLGDHFLNSYDLLN